MSNMRDKKGSIPATGVVLTFNSERMVARTLSSLDICQELLVVDSGSSDATLDIARAHGARIVRHDWEGHIVQHCFAREQVTTPWIVSLDSDEYLTEALRASIVAALAHPGRKRGFFCSRRSFYFDRYLKHSGWYPDYLLRVIRKDGYDIQGADPHQHFEPIGPTGKLKGDIIHHPYVDLADHVARINTYTTMLARGMHAKGRRTGLAGALGHGFGRFLRLYLLKLGFLDGRAGLILAVNGGFYAFHKYLRLLELDAGRWSTGQGK